MFSKILIANRGEIARRVIRTARAMGIGTVAVYSDADDDAPHVKEADEAVGIGAPAASESYLVVEKILEAARATGADAVHPGYGFLSERASFPEALAEAGITFIGPSPHAIRAMGDKIESKKLAAAAGVSTVPGFLGVIATPAEAVRIADDIGYPVMIKASAGGGGKGMRVAMNAAEVSEGFSAAMNEARGAFGDDRVFIEKFVQQPRHIEIQVLGDAHGTVIHLGERECSIQRRNQKVIEEAPSPFLDETTRAAMGAQAVALAKAVDYRSAGTVEFIVDQERNFYFLEMNTRLQVEHPVTELITGVDLVEQMIRVAAGEPLSIRQEDVALNGWAIESRVYAEDPLRNFLPSIGRLQRYAAPEAGPSPIQGAIVRVDDGVEEGSEISTYYDPMIAKLCTWAPSRETAIDAQEVALDAYELEGLGCNLAFLSAVMAHPRFREGRLTTAFIAEEYPDGFSGVTPAPDALRSLAEVAVAATEIRNARAAKIDGRFRPARPVGARDWIVMGGEEDVAVAVSTDSDVAAGQFVFAGPSAGENAARAVALDWSPGRGLAWIGEGSARRAVKIDPAGDGWRLRNGGADVTLTPRRPQAAALAKLMPVKLPPDTSKLLLCPMPGLVVRVDVAVGDTVEDGQALAVVEAMKMENILRAERRAVVKAVRAEPGDTLAVDDVILEFE